MRKVLIITYAYLDTRAIGAVRIHGLVKYLNEFGWEPVILTADTFNTMDSEFNVKIIKVSEGHKKKLRAFEKKIKTTNTNRLTSPDLHSAKKINKKIVQLFLRFYSELIFYPDKYTKWSKTAYEIAKEEIEKNSYDAIISSYKPASTHIIASKLKKKYGIPWIADFRDLWTQNHYYSYSKIRKLIEQRLELKVISKADLLTTTTKPFANELKKLHKKNVEVITNGFDEKEIDNIKADKSEQFTLTYTGMLYKGKRDPTKLLKTIKKLILNNEIDKLKIRVNFYGTREPWLFDLINKFALNGIVKYHGLVKRSVALKKQKASDILILLLWDHPKENNIPGKIFDYLGVKKPILGIGGEGGEVKKILDETNAGFFAKSEQEIQQFIINSYKSWVEKGSVDYHGIPEKVKKYTQYNMTKNFAKSLDNTILDK